MSHGPTSVDWNPPSAQIIDYVDAHPEVARAFYRIHESYRYAMKLMGSGPATLALTLRERVNARAGHQFMEGIESGVTQGEDDARLLLRETLLRQRLGSRRTMHWEEVAAFTLKAMNAYFQDKPIRMLRWKKNESMPRFDAGACSSPEKYPLLGQAADVKHSSV